MGSIESQLSCAYHFRNVTNCHATLGLRSAGKASVGRESNWSCAKKDGATLTRTCVSHSQGWLCLSLGGLGLEQFGRGEFKSVQGRMLLSRPGRFAG